MLPSLPQFLIEISNVVIYGALCLVEECTVSMLKRAAFLLAAFGLLMGIASLPVESFTQKEICESTITATREANAQNLYTSVLWGPDPSCEGVERRKKVAVVSPHVSSHLIRVQKMSLDTFMEEPFDYIVYDDSYGHAHFSNFKTEGVSKMIQEVTEAHGGVYKRVPQKFHTDRRCLFPNSLESILKPNPNTRCSDIYQFIQRDQDIFCSQAVVVFLDADIILTKHYKPSEYMAKIGVDLISVPQFRKYETQDGKHSNMTYMWTALNVLDVKSLHGLQDINWDCGKLSVLHDGTSLAKQVAIDSGGHTYDWLQKYQPKVLWLEVQLVQDSTDPDWQWWANAWRELYRKNRLLEPEFKSQILGGHFLHLRNAGNWVQAGVRYKNLQPEQNKLLVELLHKRKKKKRL